MLQNKPKSNKKQAFIEAYIKKLGNITEACIEAGIERQTYYRWIKTDKFSRLLNDAVEHHNDLIYQRILRAALDEDKEMMKFWAKTQMKHRGFVEQSNVNSNINVSGEINWKDADKFLKEVRALEAEYEKRGSVGI